HVTGGSGLAALSALVQHEEGSRKNEGWALHQSQKLTHRGSWQRRRRSGRCCPSLHLLRKGTGRRRRTLVSKHRPGGSRKSVGAEGRPARVSDSNWKATPRSFGYIKKEKCKRDDSCIQFLVRSLPK
ncbi:hypothetical protein GDO81_022062, partial [Engystomops pustulosus]